MGEFILGCIMGGILFSGSKNQVRPSIGHNEPPSGERPPDPPSTLNPNSSDNNDQT